MFTAVKAKRSAIWRENKEGYSDLGTRDTRRCAFKCRHLKLNHSIPTYNQYHNKTSLYE